MKPRSIARSLVRMMRLPFRRRPCIVMTLLCRNEEDIVGYNIAHHLAQGIDYVIATDNASQDRTPLLLERFAQRGKLHLIREPRLTHDQGAWVTRMARMAAKRFGADWVINNDADEFWLSRKGTVREALEEVPRDVECLTVPRFDMMPSRDSGRKFFEAMLISRANSMSLHGLRMQDKVCHRAYADVRVADGNHHVKRRGRPMTKRSDHPLEILHYPLRSVAQFERKIRQGAEALAANTHLAPDVGGHWRQLYREHFLRGKLDDYYNDRAPSADQIALGLVDGEFIEDTRIRDALRRIDPALADPEHR